MMVRYDIEIEVASLHAAAALMASPNYRGDPADPAGLATLAKGILAAYYSDDTGTPVPPRPLPDVI